MGVGPDQAVGAANVLFFWERLSFHAGVFMKSCAITPVVPLMSGYEAL